MRQRPCRRPAAAALTRRPPRGRPSPAGPPPPPRPLISCLGMANRAYLYPHATSAFERRKAGLPDRYYDSRHTIPVGWFFFFRARDVVLLDMGGWQQVKLAAPK